MKKKARAIGVSRSAASSHKFWTFLPGQWHYFGGRASGTRFWGPEARNAGNVAAYCNRKHDKPVDNLHHSGKIRASTPKFHMLVQIARPPG